MSIAPGAVERVSVSVVINKDLMDGEKASVANMVARAVGGDPQRDVFVEGIEFSNDFVKTLQDITDFQQQQARMRNYILLGVLFLFLLAIIYFLRRFSHRKRRQEEALLAEQIMLAQDEAVASRSIEEEMEGDQIFTEIQKYARRRPEDIAKVLRTWMDEE